MFKTILSTELGLRKYIMDEQRGLGLNNSRLVLNSFGSMWRKMILMGFFCAKNGISFSNHAMIRMKAHGEKHLINQSIVHHFVLKTYFTNLQLIANDSQDILGYQAPISSFPRMENGFWK